MRQCDFASHQRVIISDVRPLINGAVLQLHCKADAKLLKIELIPPDAQLFAECLCLLQGKNAFSAHKVKLMFMLGFERSLPGPIAVSLPWQ